MDQYIRDFTINKIQTELLENAFETNQILNVNSNVPNFKLVHVNIRSITKNIEEMEVFLSQFDHDFECIILTETWQIGNIDLIRINGFSTIYNYGNFNQNDGIVIFIKNELQYAYNVENLGNTSVVNLNISFSNHTYNILSIYRSPSINIKEFNYNLQTYLESKNCNSDYNILIGDLNIDILKKCEDSDEYLNILSEFGYISLINCSTRIQGNASSCIDHIFLNTKLNTDCIIPIVVGTAITDHFPSLIQIVLQDKKNNQDDNKNRFIQRINYKKLNNDLLHCNWDEMYHQADVESATNEFIKTVTNTIQANTKNIKLNHNERKRKCWITKGIIKSISVRDKMHKNVQNHPENLNLKQEYDTYRKTLTQVIKKTKIGYYKCLLEKHKNSSKSIWSVVKKMSANNNENNNIDKIYNQANEIVQNEEICNIFINYFSSVGKTLAEKIKNNNTFKSPSQENLNSIFLLPINENEIYNYIMKLKNKKAPGIDGIKSETLKQIAKHITKPMSYLLNKIFESGICPSAFKVSIVKPIYKKGDKMYPENYRPISIITNFAKIFEMALKSRLTSFTKRFNILSDAQLGFREGKSTQDAIVILTEKIYKALDKAKPSLCIFVDLAKAFDTVSHPKLLESLEEIGIRDIPLKLMSDYLSNRKQCVQIKNNRSNFRDIEYGVPQGTILGPLLFSIYINNLYILNTEGSIISFADDTAIFYEDENWFQLKKKVELDFKNIKNWFDSKLLTINFEKTVFIPFTSYKAFLPSFTTLQITNDSSQFQINSVESVKYLGIFIDCHLRWDVHINYTENKLRRLTYTIRHLKQIFDIKYLKMLYYALVEPHLRYGILGWGGIQNNYLCNINVIQKRILKIILGEINTCPTTYLYKKSQILDIRQLYFIELACMQYTQKKNYIQHKYTTRGKSNALLDTKKMLKTVGQRSHCFLAPRVFNSLPENIRHSNSLSIFKRLCKTYTINMPREETHKIIDIKNMSSY